MEENQKMRHETEGANVVKENIVSIEPVVMTKATADRTKLFAIVIIVVCAGVAAWFLWQSHVTPGGDVATDPVAGAGLPDIVAKVDGVPISSAEYAKYYAQSENLAQQQGVSTTDSTIVDEIKKQALEIVINTQLLYSAAQSAGKTATDADVSAQMSAIATQFATPEAFDAQLVTAGLTRESLRDEITQRIIIDSYLNDQPEMQGLSVTPDEIDAAYQRVAATNAEIPALDDVRTEIEQQLLTQKQQAASSQVIQTLRDAADIEILI